MKIHRSSEQNGINFKTLFFSIEKEMSTSNVVEFTNGIRTIFTEIQCDICNLKCLNKLSLEAHMSTKHSTQKKICKIQTKTFSHRQGLYEHMKVHSYSKESCSLCGKQFSLRRNLIRHIKMMHSEKTGIFYVGCHMF